MQTTTEFTWMLVAFVLFMGYANHVALNQLPLVWGSGMMLQIPFDIATSLMNAFPLLAPIFLIALLYYFSVLLPGAVGEGFQMFIVAAVLIMLLMI